MDIEKYDEINIGQYGKIYFEIFEEICINILEIIFKLYYNKHKI